MQKNAANSIVSLDRIAGRRTIDHKILTYSATIDIPIEGINIWLEVVSDAPSLKRLRVDYNTNDETVCGLPNALMILGLLVPSFIGPGYSVRLDNDIQHSSVSILIEPRDSNAVYGV